MTDTGAAAAIGWDGQGRRRGTVAIVAMGFSNVQYFSDVSNKGSPKAVADEIWLVNTMGLAARGDRVFIMDDLDVAMKDPVYDAQGNITGEPDVRVAALRKWVETADVPVYCPRKKHYMPTAVEYPLGAVVQSTGSKWLANTIPYMVAYANHIGVEKLKFYGCDYYSVAAAMMRPEARDPANSAWEAGMGCLVHQITLFLTQGGKIEVASTSVLLDFGLPTHGKFYGYGDAQPILKEVDGKIVHELPPDPHNVVTLQQSALQAAE